MLFAAISTRPQYHSGLKAPAIIKNPAILAYADTYSLTRYDSVHILTDSAYKV